MHEVKDDPSNDVIAKRILSRSKGEIMDHILRCRDALDDCTKIISSAFAGESKTRYYKKKFQKVLNRCRIAGSVLIEKIGNEPSDKTVLYIIKRHPDIFDDFIQEKYFKPAWVPVVKEMKEKDYISDEDLDIMHKLGMMKKYILFISASE